MYTNKNITSQRFTVRLRHLAEGLGFKKIGPFEKLLKGMKPHTVLGVNHANTRVAKLLNEIEVWKQNGAE